MVKVQKKYVTLKILRSLASQVDEFLGTTKGKRFGNRADFIQYAINSMLTQYENKEITNHP
jgi:Arc/MetJ-type ribon-helix-helix transcriptional regulator